MFSLIFFNLHSFLCICSSLPIFRDLILFLSGLLLSRPFGQLFPGTFLCNYPLNFLCLSPELDSQIPRTSGLLSLSLLSCFVENILWQFYRVKNLIQWHRAWWYKYSIYPSLETNLIITSCLLTWVTCLPKTSLYHLLGNFSNLFSVSHFFLFLSLPHYFR